MKYWKSFLKSAIANAENNHNMNKDDLYVAECFVFARVPYNEENHAKSTGQSIQNFKENITRYNRS